MYFWINYLINFLKKYIIKFSIYKDYLKLHLKKSNDIFLVLNILKLHSFFKYNILVDIACVDNLKNQKRFFLNYILLSIENNSRIVVCLDLDVKEIIQSVTSIFSGANWLEREVFDMYGVFFFEHYDLRRILTDYGFNGYPFRKDFPLNGFFEIRYDESKQYLVYESLELMQNMRFYDFISPFYKKYII
jgi:NADH dehydrogenase (ubiquinone) Fe-S protein 3